MEPVAVILPCVGINRDLPLVVECFLRQTYARRELHIVNVQGEIDFTHPLVTVHNVAPEQLPTLRHQMSYGIEAAGQRFFCKWDSDDFYAPWFLEESMQAILESPGKHVKPASGWFAQGHPMHTLSVNSSLWEGSWTLDRELLDTLLDVDWEPWYLDAAFFKIAERANQVCGYPQGKVKNYCYTWANDSEHFSGYYSRPGALYEKCRAYREHAAKHHGTGPLPRADWQAAVERLIGIMPADVAHAFQQRLDLACSFDPAVSLTAAPSGRRKLLFDLGAHHGEGLRQLEGRLGLDASWEVHVFEPNPACRLRARLQGVPYPVHIHDSAAWIRSGFIDFRQEDHQASQDGSPTDGSSAEDGWGSCLAALDSRSPGLRPAITVPCEDFAARLQECAVEDYVVVKMDIEGAEFPLLRHLRQRRLLDRMDVLFVEWHERLLGTETLASRHDLQQHVKSAGVQVLPWN